MFQRFNTIRESLPRLLQQSYYRVPQTLRFEKHITPNFLFSRFFSLLPRPGRSLEGLKQTKTALRIIIKASPSCFVTGQK